MVARSSSMSRECAGVSRGRCEGGGVETPELPGPLLQEGKVEPGSVPNARHPGPGSSADKSKCSSIPSPSPGASACPMARGPDSSSPEEREPHSVLSSGLSATSHRVRTLGHGPKAVLKRWAPRVLAAHPARRLSNLLSEGLPHDHGRRLLGLQTLPGPRHCGHVYPGWGVPTRSAKLGLPGVCRERWVRRCEGVSALGMRAGDGAKQLSDPVRWPLATGVQMGLPALS